MRAFKWTCSLASSTFQFWYCGIFSAASQHDLALINWKTLVAFQVISLLMWFAGAANESINLGYEWGERVFTK